MAGNGFHSGFFGLILRTRQHTLFLLQIGHLLNPKFIPNFRTFSLMASHLDALNRIVCKSSIHRNGSGVQFPHSRFDRLGLQHVTCHRGFSYNNARLSSIQPIVFSSALN